jgi:hypothetical protein
VGKALLVNLDLDAGLTVLRALDTSEVSVNVALWAFLPEYEDWRLILASRQFDAAGIREGYGMIRRALDAAGISVDRTPTLTIMPMNTAFIRDLRRSFRKSKSVDGMRLGGQTFGDRYVEDAYVYRIS